jgi:Mn2+/Fe2+ NRAMP family transporter
MNNWINLSALWRIVGIGLLAGAGLPAIFAVGVRALGNGSDAATDDVGGEQVIAATRTGIAIAGLCFAVVLAASGYGIYLIVRAG